MKKAFLLVPAICFMVFLSALTVQAAPVSYEATLTADNFYALYTGNTESLTYIGGNETGATDAGGYYNWQRAETFNLSVAQGDYIYVVAWSDGKTAQGWRGQFLSDSGNIYTTDTAGTVWEVCLTGAGAYNPETQQNALETQMASASWSPVADQTPYAWSTVYKTDGSFAFDKNSDWVWGSTMTGTATGEYQIFRTQVPVAQTPIPAAVWLFGTGLVGLVGVRRKIAN